MGNKSLKKKMPHEDHPEFERPQFENVIDLIENAFKTHYIDEYGQPVRMSPFDPNAMRRTMCPLVFFSKHDNDSSHEAK